MNRTLIIMVKEPRAGRVKTRLGRDIGLTASAWWFRHAVRRLLRKLSDPRWDVVLAVAPDGAVNSRCFPAQYERLPQGPGNLGDRMARMMRAAPPGPVCVIGADIPSITPAAIWRAFRALGGHDAVFGPSDDGGYWLVGVHNAAHAPAGLFAGVRWSSANALADSMASLRGARIALVDELVDVDTAEDLGRI
ncbi:TIGR04282 family arsenosugar biosynthesis glycosyltransferase [Thalassococcus lentus]|uniref:TIGR04282 family arsenosugar biosynthesis glycosyltransferase n=1 Tax=Thalassococcus lentus TaxID=1210524 RepID=A0ABT4XPB0_9RHOB|nr:TIGR04282 family arsenosugar biosynthesis glycosyltransferase [Thalassococcus lentus]MDA7423789.1 TIGR04282 family arsenosugar biosynthesis glycosyltransferase [Thalassococcus lentus]